MPVDQKISELPIANAIGNSDACILVSHGTDYQFTMSLLLQYISSNLNTGTQFSFGTALPQNTTGKNGDIFLNTSSGAFAQKFSGSWAVIYTPLASPVDSSGTTTLYGLGIPAASSGSDGDTYINTANGVFYKKLAGIWNQVFSMQSGPAGPTGPKGATGATGNDGNALLNGSADPSNQTTGKDGDFYLNTITYTLFGPKTNGVWGTGTALIQALPSPTIIDLPAGTATPVIITDYQTSYAAYTDYPTLLIMEVAQVNQIKERKDIQPVCTYKNGRLDNILIDVPGDNANRTINHLQLIIKP